MTPTTQAKPAVNLAALNTYFDRQVVKGIPYKLGGKAPSLKVAPEGVKRIDCSGEVRLLIYVASGGRITMPDGSWNQRAWCEDQGWEEVPYSRAMNPSKGELFICFITAGINGAGDVGHVWLIQERDGTAIGETMEASPGTHGVGSRSADNSTFKRRVHKCFRVPTVEGVTPQPQASQVSTAKAPVLKLNDVVIAGARYVNHTWMLPSSFRQHVSAFDDGQGEISLRDYLDRIGYKITGKGDHIAEKGEFYVYAAHQSVVVAKTEGGA